LPVFSSTGFSAAALAFSGVLSVGEAERTGIVEIENGGDCGLETESMLRETEKLETLSWAVDEDEVEVMVAGDVFPPVSNWKIFASTPVLEAIGPKENKGFVLEEAEEDVEELLKDDTEAVILPN
jgi:hypothetical protein